MKHNTWLGEIEKVERSSPASLDIVMTCWLLILFAVLFMIGLSTINAYASEEDCEEEDEHSSLFVGIVYASGEDDDEDCETPEPEPTVTHRIDATVTPIPKFTSTPTRTVDHGPTATVLQPSNTPVPSSTPTLEEATSTDVPTATRVAPNTSTPAATATLQPGNTETPKSSSTVVVSTATPSSNTPTREVTATNTPRITSTAQWVGPSPTSTSAAGCINATNTPTPEVCLVAPTSVPIDTCTISGGSNFATSDESSNIYLWVFIGAELILAVGIFGYLLLPRR